MKTYTTAVLAGSLMAMMCLPARGQGTSSAFNIHNLGLQFDINHFMGDKDVSFFSPAPAELPQSSQEGNLFGLGVSYGFQFGDDAKKYKHLALVPVLGLRMGTNNDSKTVGDYQFAGLTYQNAVLSRKTKTKELFLSVPLRWYFQEKGQLGDGFFAEGGVILAHSQQDVEVILAGEQGGGQQVNFPYEVNYSKTRGGFILGAGGSIPVGNHGLDFGLEYLSLPSSDPLPSQSLRLYVQWYF